MKKILIGGASGFVGQKLIPVLTSAGYEVYSLVRHKPESKKEIFWNPAQNEIDLHKLEGFFGFINLSGESIAIGRWTPDKKKKIIDSRVLSTSLFVEALRHIQKKPKVFLSASAIGYYGDRAGEVLNETSKAGKGFLADVCIAWEAQAKAALELNVRTCLLRFGVLLSRAGGALKAMSPAFEWGLGGPLGNGKQFMSWMDLDDVSAGILFLLENENMVGPINFVSPQAVTNLEFSKTLAVVLNRPCLLKVPGFALKIAMGEKAQALLLASAKVMPEKLLQAGFKFQYPQLKASLKHLL